MRFRPRSASVLAAALAAGLMASGCDYWRNLVDDRTVTRQRLDIKVFDVWTLQPIPEATCVDRQRDTISVTDDNGSITVPDAETGNYEITCTNPRYLDGKTNFNLSSGPIQADVRMARKGGKEFWYPDEPDRQVKILYPWDIVWNNIRFPSRFQISSEPLDTLKRFRYIWKFSRSPNLDRDAGRDSATSRVYNMDAALEDVEAGLDTLTLIVMSRMNGGGSAGEYEVGRVTKVFDWIRNIPPKISFVADLALERYKVGCPGTEDRIFSLVLSASDSDGICNGIRITTRDTNTSLGKVDTLIKDCKTPAVVLPLRNMFDKLYSDVKQEMLNTIHVTVYDDNFESTSVAGNFTTYANYLPKVTSSIQNFRPVVYTGEPVILNYAASDEDGPIIKAIANWGLNDSKHENIHAYRKQVDPPKIAEADTHIYFDTSPPEGYVISVRAYDGCGMIGYDSPGVIYVRNNNPPTINLHTAKREMQGGSLSLKLGFNLRDPEIQNSDDRLTLIRVDWNDPGDPDDYVDSTEIPFPFDQNFTHLYAAPPPTSAGYEVEITVMDAHYGGTATLDTLIALP